MLLAREYAASKVKDVTVTDKDLRDWYDDYSIQAMKAGQKLPPFEKVKAQIKPNVQAEKFLKNLQADAQVKRVDEVITKYLDSLSISEKMLSSEGGGILWIMPHRPPRAGTAEFKTKP